MVAGFSYGAAPRAQWRAASSGIATVQARIVPLERWNPWTKSILHAFTNGPDGSYPQSAFVLDKAGGLIGATSNMGAGATGVGLVFRLNRSAGGSGKWKYRALFDFNGFLSTGANPVGNLAIDRAGAIHGTTVAGGPRQLGVLYKLVRPANGTGPWTESEPARFFSDGINGAQPLGGFAVDAAGRLFGTSCVGGKYFYGAMFQVTQ